LKTNIEKLKTLFDNDLEITLAVAESLFSSKADMHSQLVKALNGGSLSELRAVIHLIKGTVSLFGESQLYFKMKGLDQILKSNPEGLESIEIETLPEEFNSFVEDIEEAVSGLRKVSS
jgi:hypothetical protein